MTLGPPLGEGNSLFAAACFFVASVVGLVALHRAIAVRKLGSVLTGQRVDEAEQGAVIFNEGVTVAATVGISLAVALVLVLVLVLVGNVLGGAEWLTTRVPWAVATIPRGASLLLLGFVALFIRGLGREEHG